MTAPDGQIPEQLRFSLKERREAVIFYCEAVLRLPDAVPGSVGLNAPAVQDAGEEVPAFRQAAK